MVNIPNKKELIDSIINSESKCHLTNEFEDETIDIIRVKEGVLFEFNDDDGNEKFIDEIDIDYISTLIDDSKSINCKPLNMFDLDYIKKYDKIEPY